MLRFYRFSAEVPAPTPARAVYEKRGPGRGWPEECPPVRAANAFGWDVSAAFDMDFHRSSDGGWRIESPVDLESDWAYAAPEAETDDGEGAPLVQRNAWFWDKDQTLPHAISPEVYEEIRNQVKISTYLFLATGDNELLFFADIPNLSRPFRVISALVDTDWYPASYPWHCVIELDAGRDHVRISAGDPLCRIFTVQRADYAAREMSPTEFEAYFYRTQEWLRRYGKGHHGDMVDVTGNYGKQQRLSRFSVTL